MTTPSLHVCPWAAWAVVANPGANGNCFRTAAARHCLRPGRASLGAAFPPCPAWPSLSRHHSFSSPTNLLHWFNLGPLQNCLFYFRNPTLSILGPATCHHPKWKLTINQHGVTRWNQIDHKGSTPDSCQSQQSFSIPTLVLNPITPSISHKRLNPTTVLTPNHRSLSPPSFSIPQSVPIPTSSGCTLSPAKRLLAGQHCLPMARQAAAHCAPPHHHGSAALPTTPAKRLYDLAFFHNYFYMLWPKDVYCISSAGLFIYDISCYIMVIMCMPRPELLRPRHVGVDGPLHQHIVFFQSILEWCLNIFWAIHIDIWQPIEDLTHILQGFGSHRLYYSSKNMDSSSFWITFWPALILASISPPFMGGSAAPGR